MRDMERETLIAGICEKPNDPLPRLLFADFLEGERYDTEGNAEWAEYIRLHWTELFPGVLPLPTIHEYWSKKRDARLKELGKYGAIKWMLNSLHSERAIKFQPTDIQWQWDKGFVTLMRCHIHDIREVVDYCRCMPVRQINLFQTFIEADIGNNRGEGPQQREVQVDRGHIRIVKVPVINGKPWTLEYASQAAIDSGGSRVVTNDESIFGGPILTEDGRRIRMDPIDDGEYKDLWKEFTTRHELLDNFLPTLKSWDLFHSLRDIPDPRPAARPARRH